MGAAAGNVSQGKWQEVQEDGSFQAAAQCAVKVSSSALDTRPSLAFNDVMDQIDNEAIPQPRPKSPRETVDCKTLGGLVCHNQQGERVHVFVGACKSCRRCPKRCDSWTGHHCVQVSSTSCRILA